MSDLSYLDTISHKELHAKCLEYGLPNIPVTDSSRNVIARRLRAAILGVPLNKTKNVAAATKQTTRRETVHGSKVTPAAELNIRNANANVNRVSDTSASRNRNNNTYSRRTIAAEPRNNNAEHNVSVRSVETTTTVSDIGSQSEDDDVNYSSRYSNATQTAPDARQRRSVSLTKSGVLTTSYTRETEQPHYSDEEQAQSYTYQRPQVAPLYSLPGIGTHVEHVYGSSMPRKQLTQTHLNSSSIFENADDNEPFRREASNNVYSGSAAPFNSTALPTSLIQRQTIGDSGFAAFNSTAAATSSTRQRQTIGDSGIVRGRLLQPSYAINTLYPQLNQFYDQHNDAVEPMDTESESEPEILHRSQNSARHTSKSTYDSQFARHLNAKQRSSPLARPLNRPPLARNDQNSPGERFRALVTSLNKQYHLKFYFYLMSAVIFATMIYVVLTP